MYIFFICLSNRLSVSCLCFLCVFFQSINLSALFICPSAWLMMHSAFWSGRPFICLNRYRYQLVRLSKCPLDFSSVNPSTSVAFFFYNQFLFSLTDNIHGGHWGPEIYRSWVCLCVYVYVCVCVCMCACVNRLKLGFANVMQLCKWGAKIKWGANLKPHLLLARNRVFRSCLCF